MQRVASRQNGSCSRQSVGRGQYLLSLELLTHLGLTLDFLSEKQGILDDACSVFLHLLFLSTHRKRMQKKAKCLEGKFKCNCHLALRSQGCDAGGTLGRCLAPSPSPCTHSTRLQSTSSKVKALYYVLHLTVLTNPSQLSLCKN